MMENNNEIQKAINDYKSEVGFFDYLKNKFENTYDVFQFFHCRWRNSASLQRVDSASYKYCDIATCNGDGCDDVFVAQAIFVDSECFANSEDQTMKVAKAISSIPITLLTLAAIENEMKKEQPDYNEIKKITSIALDISGREK